MLKFDGVSMPEPSEVSVSPEKIWSSDTGRGDNGEMVGDLVAIKLTVKLVWKVLSAEQTKLLDQYLSKPFFNCTFLNPRKGNKEETIKVYAGTPTYPAYSYVNGLPEYVGTGVDLIEK